MYTTVFSDFVLPAQGINSALSSLARGPFQGDKKADPVGSCCLGWREGGTGVRRTLCPGTQHLSVRSLSSQVSGDKEQGGACGIPSDELSVHPSLR